jgi:hypothetical protein
MTRAAAFFAGVMLGAALRYGIRAGALRWLGPVSDESLEVRARQQLDRLCSHPRAVQLVVRGGRIEVRGDIRAPELGPVLHALARIRGADRVVSHLHPYDPLQWRPS